MSLAIFRPLKSWPSYLTDRSDARIVCLWLHRTFGFLVGEKFTPAEFICLEYVFGLWHDLCENLSCVESKSLHVCGHQLKELCSKNHILLLSNYVWILTSLIWGALFLEELYPPQVVIYSDITTKKVGTNLSSISPSVLTMLDQFIRTWLFNFWNYFATSVFTFYTVHRRTFSFFFFFSEVCGMCNLKILYFLDYRDGS